MTRIKKTVLAAILFLGLALLAFGADEAAPELTKGAKAPALKVGKWIKGNPVDQLDPTKVYVVEFWATWCGPCRKTVPHLTELAHRYKDKLVVIGVSIAENEKKDEARYKAVAEFVKGMGSKMDYRVAADTTDGYMSRVWMDAAKQDGIPVAFVVSRNGTIAWIGSPLDGLDKALAGIMATP